jgi:hypothetical protein
MILYGSQNLIFTPRFFIVNWFESMVILPGIMVWVLVAYGDRGSTVVKVLRYKSEGRWFDPRWCHWNFSLTYSF